MKHDHKAIAERRWRGDADERAVGEKAPDRDIGRARPVVTLTRDRELWGCALQVLRQHGEAAPKLIAGRVTALASAGDEIGVSTWLAIATRMDQLMVGLKDGAPS